MKKARIVKRVHVNGSVMYVIQRRHFLFRWWWRDAYREARSVWTGYFYNQLECYPCLENAKKHLCRYDGTKIRDEEVE